MLFVKVTHVSSIGASTVITMRAAVNRTITTKYMPKINFLIPACYRTEWEMRRWRFSEILDAPRRFLLARNLQEHPVLHPDGPLNHESACLSSEMNSPSDSSVCQRHIQRTITYIDFLRYITILYKYPT